MADQATLRNGMGGARDAQNTVPSPVSNRIGTATEPAASPAQLASNVAGLGENLLNMGELQVRLTAIELRQNVNALKFATVIGAGGAILALAALPIVLAAVAELLVSEIGWRRGWALMLVGFGSLCIGAFAIGSAGIWTSRKRLGFPLSGEEFTRNLAWLRTIVRLSGRPPIRRS